MFNLSPAALAMSIYSRAGESRPKERVSEWSTLIRKRMLTQMDRYIQDMGSTITRLETQIQRQNEFHRAEVQSLHTMIQRLEAQLQGCHETIERHERLLSTSQNASERDGPRNNGLQRLATAAAEDDG